MAAINPDHVAFAVTYESTRRVAASFRECLDSKISEGDFAGIATRVKRRVEDFESDLARAIADLARDRRLSADNATQSNIGASTGGSVTNTSTALAPAPTSPYRIASAFRLEPWAVSGTRDGLAITLTGPGNAIGQCMASDKDHAEYILGDDYLGFIQENCEFFESSEMDFSRMSELDRTLEPQRASLTQLERNTVLDRIRHLKDLNDVRDVGQQLIGIVAESREVTVQSLYESREFGVDAEDNQ